MRRTRVGLVLLAMLMIGAASARAQSADEPPAVAIRPFALVTGEQFTARRSFEAAFGRAFQPTWGGGVDVLIHGDIFVDVAASRFQKTGERAFITGTAAFPLGIPLNVTLTPLEVTGGYRFRRVSTRVIPYVGAGVGSYAYSEQSPPPYADSGENLNVRHTGYLVVGGAEVRLHRWIGVAVDGQFTRISGILGQGGLSQAAGENDLGGAAVRARVLIGR